MSLREYSSRRRWRLAGPVREGGTVYAMVLSPSADQHHPLIAGSPVGAFRSLSRGDQWSWANRGLAGLQVSALAASTNGVLFLGTLDGTLARSIDGGYSWECMPTLEDSGSITALAVSPDYLKDGTVLIGTETGGVFRTTDSGRTSRPANFGLQDPTVLALSCAPGWPDNPVAFVGTVDGLYRSTNGGRAWRPAGTDLDGLSVQAVVASPAYGRDRTVFAGTEEDGLFRSKDGGATWEPIGSDTLDCTINAIWVAPSFRESGVVLVGTAGGGIFRSEDRGDSWQAVFHPGGATLCLTGDGESVFAGFHGNGVSRSQDGGGTWAEVRDGLYAHAFTHLVASEGGRLFVTGPDTGLFTSTDGTEWSAVSMPAELSALAAIAVWPEYHRLPLIVVADAASGVHLTRDGGESWALILEQTVTALATARTSASAVIFAGTADGGLAVSGDQGVSWGTSSPFAGETVLKIEASPQFIKDDTLIAATRAVSGESSLSFWRSTDGGDSWTKIGEEVTTLLHTALLLRPGEPALAAAVFDRTCLVQQSEGHWVKFSLSQHDSPALLCLAHRTGLGEDYLVLGSAVGVFGSDDGTHWSPMNRGMGYAPVLAMTPSAGTREQPLWALALGGLIWAWEATG